MRSGQLLAIVVAGLTLTVAAPALVVPFAVATGVLAALVVVRTDDTDTRSVRRWAAARDALTRRTR